MASKKVEELVGVKEIARRANVSIGTVDRVLHNRPGVSAKTRDRINAIIAELDYQPNILARRLASKKVLKIAALIPAVSSETGYWEAPLKGIYQAESEIRSYGIEVGLHFFNLNDRLSFVKEADRVRKGRYDGILLAPIFVEEARRFAEACRTDGIPLVFINSDISECANLSYIGPDLYQSGYVGAHLINYLVGENDPVLLVNISKEIENDHHLLQKEDGFRAYFSDHQKANAILKSDIRNTDYLSIKKELSVIMKDHPVKGIFVTNSRVSSVAAFITESARFKVPLVGFDFLNENIRFLDKGVIDFLICQKPKEQAYRGVMTLYNKLVHQQMPETRSYYMPIDIITSVNYKYYQN